MAASTQNGRLPRPRLRMRNWAGEAPVKEKRLYEDEVTTMDAGQQELRVFLVARCGGQGTCGNPFPSCEGLRADQRFLTSCMPVTWELCSAQAALSCGWIRWPW